MSEEKYKIKFKDHKENWRYTKSFDSKQAAELAKLVIETTMFSMLPLAPYLVPIAEIVEVCPSCESESINTNNGDCWCAECGHKWNY